MQRLVQLLDIVRAHVEYFEIRQVEHIDVQLTDFVARKIENHQVGELVDGARRDLDEAVGKYQFRVGGSFVPSDNKRYVVHYLNYKRI